MGKLNIICYQEGYRRCVLVLAALGIAGCTPAGSEQQSLELGVSAEHFAHSEQKNRAFDLKQVPPKASGYSGAPLRPFNGRILDFPAANISLLSHLTVSEMNEDAGLDSAYCNDLVGFRNSEQKDIACIGCERSVNCYDMSEPTGPIHLFSDEAGPSMWGSSAYLPWLNLLCHATDFDIEKVRQGIYCYDFSDSANIELDTLVLLPQTRHSHNIHAVLDPGIEHPYLYSCLDVADGLGAIFKLSVDPERDEGATIVDSIIFDDGAGGGEFGDGSGCHDVTSCVFGTDSETERVILAIGAGSGGLAIIDSTQETMNFISEGERQPNQAYLHQCDCAEIEGRRYVLCNDELDEVVGRAAYTQTHVYELDESFAPSYLGAFTNGLNSIDHNLYVAQWDSKVFAVEANYTSGLQVFRLDPDPLNPTRVAYFDSVPGFDSTDESTGYSGLWGPWPIEEGIIYGSDIDQGLFTWKFESDAPSVSSPDTTLRVVGTSAGSGCDSSGAGFLVWALIMSLFCSRWRLVARS